MEKLVKRQTRAAIIRCGKFLMTTFRQSLIYAV